MTATFLGATPTQVNRYIRALERTSTPHEIADLRQECGIEEMAGAPPALTRAYTASARRYGEGEQSAEEFAQEALNNKAVDQERERLLAQLNAEREKVAKERHALRLEREELEQVRRLGAVEQAAAAVNAKAAQTDSLQAATLRMALARVTDAVATALTLTNFGLEQVNRALQDALEAVSDERDET